MFTGLIETIGTIVSVSLSGLSCTMGIRSDKRDFAVKIGDSVAIDGACLTVERINEGVLFFTAVKETHNPTTQAHPVQGRRVNLERAMVLGARLDGHLVSGHVDGVGKILSDTTVGVSVSRLISVPENLYPFIAEKGSIAIDGISLTIAQSSINTFSVSLIPHTWSETTMAFKKTGDPVNLECDLVARYLYRFYSMDRNGSVAKSSSSLGEKLERLGF